MTVTGVPTGRPMVFVHGFGCDQAMWRFVAPDFEVDHRVVLLDLVGSGRSDLTAYDPEKYGSLRGYAATSSRSAGSSASPTSCSSATR